MQNSVLELEQENIGKLLRKYAVPAIIAMTASSLYNIVDSMFIGHGVGNAALSGLGVCFPLMNLSTAFGTLVGVGASTMLSVLLGRHKYKEANRVLGNLVSLNIMVGLVFMAVCLIWMDPILRVFGASDVTLPYARSYMEIILYGNVVTHLYFGLNSAMRSSGSPKFAMGLTLFTVIFNTILDPVFIFGLGLGVRGAAIATVISQFVALVIIVVAFSKRSRKVHFEKTIAQFDVKTALQCLEIGMGPFLMNAAACIVNIFLNQQLYRYIGDDGIGAYSIVHRISFLFIMVVMGLTQGMQPIAGYNYGARKYSRLRQVYKLTAMWASGVTVVGFIASEVFPVLMCRAFTSDPTMLELSSTALRYMNVVFPIIGFQIVSVNLFQSIGMVRKSIFLSLSRQLLFLVPAAYILPLFMGGLGVWLCFPVSDAISVFMALYLIHRLMRKMSTLEDGDSPEILGSNL